MTEGCRLATPDRQQLTQGAMIVRGTLQFAGGLAEKTIAIAGLEATITDVLVRLAWLDEWVLGIENHDACLARLGFDRVRSLRV